MNELRMTPAHPKHYQQCSFIESQPKLSYPSEWDIHTSTAKLQNCGSPSGDAFSSVGLWIQQTDHTI